MCITLARGLRTASRQICDGGKSDTSGIYQRLPPLGKRREHLKYRDSETSGYYLICDSVASFRLFTHGQMS